MPVGPRISRFYANTLSNKQLFQLSMGYFDHLLKDQYKLWNSFIFTVMFRHIGGSDENRNFVMQKELHRVYEVLSTILIRDPHSERGYELLPRFVMFADCSDIAMINGSTHYQGIALFYPINRTGEPIQVLVERYQKVLCGRHGLVERVHVEPVTHSPYKVRRYIAKAVLKRKATLDDVVILPKTRDQYRKRGSTTKPVVRQAQRFRLPQNKSWYAKDCFAYRANGKRRYF